MKQFIKHPIVMLPTDKDSNISLGLNNLLVNTSNKSAIQNRNEDFINQHLYILSDEPIKDGDWCYDYYLKTIIQNKNLTKGQLLHCKKIIVTIDKEIRIKNINGVLGLILPQLSQEFIKYFIDKYNDSGKAINYVEVEYEYKEDIKEFSDNNLRGIEVSNQREELLINPDNTINIKLPI